MKILFIDYIWRIGHVNYNRIHIDALRSKGFNVKLIMYKSMKDRLPYTNSDYVMIIPDFLKMHEGHPIMNRLGFLIVLFIIHCRVPLSAYDKVYVSSFDELTLGVFPLGKKMLLVAHDNAKGFRYKSKRYFLHKLSKYGTYLVFNKYMASAFISEGITNVQIISHGCINVHNIKTSETNFDYKKFSMVIFQASVKADDSFYERIVLNQKFQDFLRERNILLILRNSNIPSKYANNTISINRFLEKDEYNTLLMQSKVILLAYPSSFKYQVSGVGFECVAMNKCMAIYDNRSLYYCKDYFNYNPIFTDYMSFKILLINIMENPKLGCIVNADKISPDYSFINNAK